MSKPTDTELTPFNIVEPFMKIGALTEVALNRVLEKDGLEPVERTLYELRLAQLEAARVALNEAGEQFIEKLDEDMAEKVKAALENEAFRRFLECLASKIEAEAKAA